jgi:hypothetical protein
MTPELVQTLVNAVLLIGVTLIGGSIGLKRFEALERRLDRLEAKMDDRFDGVDRRFETVDRRFETVDRRFDAVDGRFDAVDGRFDAVDGRFDAVDRRFETVDDRFEALRVALSHDIAVVDGHVGEVRAELAQTRSDLTYVALAVGAHRSEGSA